jgi:hypothetical protein
MLSMRASINPLIHILRAGAFKLPDSIQTKYHIVLISGDQELSSYHASSSCRKIIEKRK